MLTKTQVLEAVRSGERKTNCFIDGRDFGRLVEFFEPEHWSNFGFEVRDDVDVSSITTRPWTRAELSKQVLADARFGLEKAENERCVSSGMMIGVLTTWSWVMEDNELHGSDADGYGVRFFRDAVQRYESVVRSCEVDDAGPITESSDDPSAP